MSKKSTPSKYSPLQFVIAQASAKLLTKQNKEEGKGSSSSCKTSNINYKTSSINRISRNRISKYKTFWRPCLEEMLTEKEIKVDDAKVYC